MSLLDANGSPIPDDTPPPPKHPFGFFHIPADARLIVRPNDIDPEPTYPWAAGGYDRDYARVRLHTTNNNEG